MQGLGFARVVPHAAAARCGSAHSRVDRDDRTKARLRIEDMMDALVACKGRLVEHGAAPGRRGRARWRAYSPKTRAREP